MTEKTEFARLWSDAVTEYFNRMGRTFDTGKLTSRVTNSADEVEMLIEDHKSNFAQFRATHGKLIKVFYSVTKHLQNLSKIAQAGIGLTPFAPASIIIEAACFLIDASSAVSETYDSLEILFQKIQDIIDRLEEYLKGTIDDKFRKVIVNLLCSLLEVFGEAEQAVKRGRGKEMMRRVAGKENKVQSALDRLDRMLQTELGLVAAKTYATARMIDEKMDNTSNQSLLDEALSANISYDMNRLYTEIEETRLPQSGQWLLNQQRFRRWVEMKFPVLWILGKPGTGKTYLASRIITFLRELQPCHGYVGYFYIRESMQTQYTPSIILTSIACQITKQSDAYRKKAISLCKDGSGLLSPRLIWESLFVEYFSRDNSRPIFIIIDGVDELLPIHQNALLVMAKQLSDLRVQSKYPLIQILLLGRPDLEFGLSNVWARSKKRPKVIQVQSSKSRDDLEKFVRTGVDGISLLQKMKMSQKKSIRRHAKGLRSEVISTLCQNADGMFMLAKLMLAEIKDMNKPELIKRTLNNCPEGLDDMFKRVIEKLAVIGGFDKHDLNEIIMWVACAKRDLLLGEIDLVIKLRDLQQGGLYTLEDELRTRFGSFFTISGVDSNAVNEDEDESVVGENPTDVFPETAEVIGNVDQEVEDDEIENQDTDTSNWTETDSEEGDGDDGDSEEDIPSNFSIATVKFSHASVGQYFRTQGFHKGIGIDLNVARAHVLQTCLLFLTDHIPKKNGEEWSPPDLLGYSADHLLDHLVEVDIEALRNSQPKKFSNISDEVFFLFRNSDALGRWYSKLSDKQKLIYQLFGRTDICSRIQEWIPGHTAASRSEARWLKQAKSSPQALLRPFAQFIVKLWLGYNRMDGFIPIVFLDGYISMNDQSRPLWVSGLKRPLKQIVQKMSPIHIRRIASYGNLKRTILWHLYLGTTLMHVATPQHIIAAIREFRRAKRKHGLIWILHFEEAVGLYCLQLYRESIEAAAHALEQEEFQDEESKCALLGLVRLSNLELGDFESAIKAAEEVCRIAPRSPLSVLKMIGTYYTTGRFLESARYIQSIMNHEGLLVDAINANPLSSQLISTTCMESGQLDLAQDIFTRAATEAEASGDTDRAVSAKMALSNLYLRYYDADKAIESWESLAIDPLSTNEGVQVACLLASLYYTKAIDRNEDNEYWTAKLQTMNERLNSRLMGNETHDQTRYDLLGAAALLGRWYMEHGDMQKARLVIQPLIQIGVDELTDRDDANDMVAYSTLGRGLISLGDRQNAEIAWAFGYPLQKSNELQEIEMREASRNSPIAEDQGESTRYGNRTTKTVKTSLENAEKNLFYFDGECDGLCSRRTVHFRSFSICEICVDLGFCDGCLQKLRDGKFPYRICDAKHPFVEVYPPKGLVTKVDGEFKVQSVEGGIIGVDEWLSTISRRWLTG